MSQTPLSTEDKNTLASAGQCAVSAIETIEGKLTQAEIDILKAIAARIRALGG